MSRRTFKRTVPGKTGLYDPAFEKDSCGIGFVCDIKGRSSHSIVKDAYNMNCCMEHRGGVGYETNTGDGAGIMTGMPHDFLNATAKDLFGRELPEPASTGLVIYFYPPIPPSEHDARALSNRLSKMQVKR